ncbi:LemA family protein [Sporosalibacterium faouarense]|uniref:LemA family protein n=1 Tax=Sporosalibacterium faouarense TaxID=516123 RepID=UPI00141D6AF9|nr:LemA family protein [Sporosalibacterium faouarense]MTI48531.1 LemA family protein [Bacillota bacterium]
MKKTLIIVAVVILLVVVLPIMIFAGTYNSLVSLDEEVNSNWAQVENQLKRRSDLIPNLVETVKGFANQEQEVLTKVTEARSKVMVANSPQELANANANLSTALQGLNVVVERYPELKSDKNFIQLQDELAGTENRIAVARMDYNESVQGLNNKIRKFPTNIIASMFNIEKREYFEVSEEDQENPEVKFD